MSGAKGFKIYRAIKKKGKYRLIKTIKKGSTVSYKNTKLSRSRKYFFIKCRLIGRLERNMSTVCIRW